MLLTNIAFADQEGRPLSYSRNKNHAYCDITVGRVLSGVAKIVSADLAVERRTKPGHRGWQSDLRGTPVLTEILDKHGEKPVYGPRASIIARSRKDGSLLPMWPARDQLRQVDRINEMLPPTAIGLEMTGAIKLQNGLWLFERLDEDQFWTPRLIQQRLRLDEMGGRRVFTSDHKRHGRFYCPAQNIPGSARLLMTLSGAQVVELDFQSMHPALAYSRCGAIMDGDPYDGIPGFTRKQAKIGLLTALNARSIEAAIASLTDNRQRKRVCATRGEAQRLLEALRVRHAPIAKMLCSDAGMRLMNIDSRIMMTATDRLIAKGIEAIPVHDSIVVAEHHEGEAREALNFGWYGQNPELNPCYIKKKCPKSLQYGHKGPGASLSGPADPDLGSEGWWSSVISEARFDVGEWVSA
jgi:hypothetical protein